MSIFNQLSYSNVTGLTGIRCKPYIEGWEFFYEFDEDATSIIPDRVPSIITISGTGTSADGDVPFDSIADGKPYWWDGVPGGTEVEFFGGSWTVQITGETWTHPSGTETLPPKTGWPISVPGGEPAPTLAYEEVKPVTLAEAKAFARIDPTGDSSADTDNDNIVTELINAATNVFESQTGRAILSQTWIAWLDCIPCSDILHLNKGRIVSVTEINGYSEDGTPVTLDASAYEVDNQNARIGLVGTTFWPTATRLIKGFSVEYVAGYGGASDVPEDAKTAIKQMVSHWFEHRETATDLSFQTVPYSTKLLINRLKVGRV